MGRVRNGVVEVPIPEVSRREGRLWRQKSGKFALVQEGSVLKIERRVHRPPSHTPQPLDGPWLAGAPVRCLQSRGRKFNDF
jgi:hypothetical protein